MNNKKITIIFILISISLLLGIVGFTFAYFTSSTDFDNEFGTALFQTQASEVFTSPQNWLPGNTTPKTLTIKNTGNVDVKARVCISEEWESDNGEILDNIRHGDRMAILNLDNTDDWTQIGPCYIYNEILEPNDETNSFIESVTFNPNVEANIDCTTSGNTKTCTSSGDGYDNATYTLTFTVDTIQADAESILWTTTTKYSFPEDGLRMYDTVADSELYDTFDEVASIYGLPICIKYVLYNNRIIDWYLEYEITEENAQSNPGLVAGRYSLKAGAYENNLDLKPVFNANKQILDDSFGSSRCETYDNLGRYTCRVNGSNKLFVSVSDDGSTYALDGSEWNCQIGYFIGTELMAACIM